MTRMTVAGICVLIAALHDCKVPPAASFRHVHVREFLSLARPQTPARMETAAMHVRPPGCFLGVNEG